MQPEDTLKILLVEDDVDDAFLLEDLLREGEWPSKPLITVVHNGKQALEAFDNENYDFAFFDYSLGEINGLDLLRIVRDRDIHIPIIFLTGQGDQQIAVDAMKNGATDYHAKKDLSKDSLMHSMRIALQLKKEEDLRRSAEELLKNYNEELASKNLELKSSMDKLQNAQNHILRSEKLASIGRLSAGVCHEILNPLNIISGHIQALMLERTEDVSLGEDMQSIMEEVYRIEKIIGGLLKFSRKEQLEFKTVDINDELESVIVIIEKEMALDNILIERKFNDELPQIKIDADRMRQVFLNLINNSRFAMDGGGTLTIATSLRMKSSAFVQETENGNSPSEKLEEEPYLCVEFQDTGVGIKQENINKLFDPFFTTKPEDKGTGLGLAVCHTIIEKHHGVISVESDYGNGATFSIELPVNDPIDATEESEMFIS